MLCLNNRPWASVSASSTSPRRFAPAYIGLEVDNPTAVFDDFIISTADPRYVLFSGLPGGGYGVSVIDNLGNLVNSTVSTSASVALGVIPDIVVGTGVDGSIVITRPSGYACLAYVAPDSILGGDSYSLSTSYITSTIGPNSTSATINVPISGSSSCTSYALPLRIRNNDAKPYYARLLLNSQSSLSPGLYLDVTLSSSPTDVVSPSIRIVDGTPVSSATGWLTINPGQTVYVYMWGTAHHRRARPSSTCTLSTAQLRAGWAPVSTTR